MSLGTVLAAPGEENNFQNAYIELVLASYVRIDLTGSFCTKRFDRN